MNIDYLTILKKLISFKSITPNSNGSIEYIATILSKIGFKCDIQIIGTKYKVTNLYAIYGNESPNICFAGHVDVVPIVNKNLWLSNPFKMTIINNNVYGRGTVDMKGAISVSIAVAYNFIKNTPNFKGAISFLLTSDEEGEAKYGIKKMIKHIKNQVPKINLCILGEPTSKNFIGDVIKIGRRGSINFILKVIGIEGHVAYPDQTNNPIIIMNKIIYDLSNINLDKGSKFFQPSILQITSIDTNNYASNIIPKLITSRFNVRYNTNYNIKTMVKFIQNIINKHTQNYTLNYNCTARPFIQKYSNIIEQFIKIIKENCQGKTILSTEGGTSDARFIYPYTNVVELGLKSSFAHKINEHSTINDLHNLYNLYYAALNKFLD